MTRTLVFAVAVLLATFHFGDCLRCYVCSSSSNPHCRDPFNPNGELITEDCGGNAVRDTNQKLITALRYIQQYQVTNSVPFSPGSPKACHKLVFPTGETIRTCLDSAKPYSTYGGKNETCQGWIQNGINLQYCSSCEGDACNGATTQTLSIFAGTLSLILSYFLLKQ